MFQIAQAIQDANQELNLVGQRVSTSDFLLYFHRANRYFNTHYKMPTAQRTKDYLLFNGVYEYEVPSDCLALIPFVRPYGLESPMFEHEDQQAFAYFKNGNKDAIKFDKENQVLIVNYTDGQTETISSLDEADDGVTQWVISGDGADLKSDGQIYVQGNGSLRFTVTANTGVTNLTTSTLPSTDISDYLDNGYFFVHIQNPSTTAISSLTLKVGNDASNYYNISATGLYRGGTIGYNWGQVGFDMSVKATVGNPDPTDITYIEISIANGALSGTFRLDNLILALPTYFQLPYYSIYNVKTAAGAYIERPTSTSDYILCPEGLSEAYEYKVLEYCAVEKIEDSGLANYFRNELRLKENKLKQQYPRLDRLNQTNWYKNGQTF